MAVPCETWSRARRGKPGKRGWPAPLRDLVLSVSLTVSPTAPKEPGPPFVTVISARRAFVTVFLYLWFQATNAGAFAFPRALF